MVSFLFFYKETSLFYRGKKIIFTDFFSGIRRPYGAWVYIKQ